MTDCLWDGQVLELSLQDVARLPDEILEILSHGTNTQYLDHLASLALDPTWTEVIFTKYEPLFVDFGSRWSLRSATNVSLSIRALAALSRILPFSPVLAVHIQELLSFGHLGRFRTTHNSALAAVLSDLTSGELTQILMSLLRLLDFDHHSFSSQICASQVQALLSHDDYNVRYLACRILSLLFHFTSKTMASHIERYCGAGALKGCLDDIDIDFRYLDLWEGHRRRRLDEILKTYREGRSNGQSRRLITATDLCCRSVDFAGYIAPSSAVSIPKPASMVSCPTADKNLKDVAESICSHRPALIIGVAGSGKTVIVEEIATRLGQSSKMLTLHLNAQTDAKLLIGLYTSDVESGTFKWQPGVLTTAVQEGRWVLIEDLDRAPSEVMSVLLPLLDTRELMVPNLGGSIRAASGFKLIGTIRTNENDKGEEAAVPEFLGSRHWRKVSLEQYSTSDLRQILSISFPLLQYLQDRILSMFNGIKRFAQPVKTTQSGTRVFGLQELLRFCARSSDLLEAGGMTKKSDTFPASLGVHIFLEAMDIFCGSMPPGVIKAQMISLIALELHISAETVRFCVELRIPTCEQRSRSINYGRVELPLRQSQTNGTLNKQKIKRPFAQTNHSLKYIESIASAVKAKDPCLLVGETGTGKTTIVQELASAVGQKLFVVNLSQQSEAGDLLGGFKPVTLKSLATPIRDEFDLLFDETLNSTKNEKFLSSLNRNFKKGEWSRVLKLWQEASKTASAALKAKSEIGENPSKKRKLDASKYKGLKTRWSQINSDMELFRKHLESGSKGFAFSFMEGNLVKAVKNGQWILLDEINLASPDTLESLADLLSSNIHKSPSILLSEAGKVERIHGHEDFRIFAAMNPATDVGKRELPSSIRSRFSEYYISSCEDDIASLLQICSAYLGDYTYSDNRITRDVANLYQSIRALEKDNRLVDGASQRPHFTLRTLSRTLTYAMDIVNTYGLRRSLYEGFCMSFLTLLDRTSISLVSPLIYQNLLASKKNVRSILDQIPKCPGDANLYVQFHHYWMSKGQFSVLEQPHYIITPFVEANLLNLIRATSTRRYPILLQGPTSSGKTSMVEYLANISGNKFVRINNHEHTDLQEYLGTYTSGNGGLQFQDGVLIKALREGHWLVLDELNLAPTDILEALNRLLDDNRELLVPETQEIVHPHPNFMLFATQNPPGLYGGRKILSRAFRNRFLELHFDDIPENELETILKERSQIAPSYCTRIVEVYKRLTVLRQSNRLFEQKYSFATLRDLFRWAFRDADNVEQLAIHGYMLIGERIRDPTERLAVKAIIEEVMKVNIDTSKLYSLDDALLDRIKSSGPLSGNVRMTKAMARLYILVSAALKNKEPILLIGDTGCGKTTLCQLIAEVLGSELHMLNAHQNTETGDIIGALRPVRNRQHIASNLHIILQQLYEQFYEVDSQTSNTCQMTLDDLTDWYSNLPESARSKIPPEQRNQLKELFAKSTNLFEWADGILVTAMRSGHHFLLDEISLADDSVLERFNSVLEPSRTLLLAEKGATDALVIAHPDFQFLATMNPGGDYGKKELSPALRNRFTEIWVPELDDDEDLLDIARSKLSQSLRHLASSIVEFARWFEKHCGENKTTVSLRQILAWLEFLSMNDIADLDARLVHGAAMVYIDGIGADPAAKTYIHQDDIETRRSRCLHQLEVLFQIPAHNIYHASLQLSINEHTISIGPFSIRANRSIISDSTFNLNTSTTLKNALRMARGLQIPKPILVEGSPGVGKTSLVEAIAHMVGIPLTRINLSEQTDLMDLFGSDVPVENGSLGQFEWRDAPFLTAMQKGEWVLLDEMNLASQSVLEGLNACLDHRGEVFIPELDKVFIKHPRFTLFAAQNPQAQGGGRKGLPASFVNRFTVVFAEPLTEDDMVQISTGLFPQVDTGTARRLVSYISELNSYITSPHALSIVGGPWEFNLRDVLRWMILIDNQDSTVSAAASGDFESMLVLGRIRTPEDRRAVSKNISPPFSDVSRARVQYTNFAARFLQCGLALWQKSIVSNTAMQLAESHDQGILESVMITIERNWPCLLVGPSGCGKSRLIRGLASAYGANITILALNNEMDTMDIVGGYEQVDYSRHMKSLLKDIQEEVRLLWARSSLEAFENKLASVWNLLMQEKTDLSLLANKLHDPAFEECADIQELVTRLDQTSQLTTQSIGAKFEWVDGILVEAIQRGDWLILDNANLCNASVLDRLNALLEPNGILSLNEHRLEDGSPRIITRNPNFRLFLTMDPRHGELSRAMRNRCVELYLPLDGAYVSDPHAISSFTSQPVLEFLEKLDWNGLSTAETDALMTVSLSRFSTADHLHFDAWYEQVLKGLHNVEPKFHLRLKDIQKSFRQAYSKPSITQALRQLHADYLKLAKLKESDCLSIELDQSIDLTVNTALISLARKEKDIEYLISLVELCNTRLQLAQFQQQLGKIQEGLLSNPRQHLNSLEKSLIVHAERKFAKEISAPVGVLFSSMITSLESQLDIQILSVPQSILECSELVSYCKDLFEVTNNLQFDEGLFLAYIRRGWVLHHSLQRSKTGNPSQSVFKHSLELFGSINAVQPMEILWTYFKPTTPMSPDLLAQALRLNDLAERLDTVLWKSATPIESIVKLKMLFQDRCQQSGLDSVLSIQELEHLVTEEERSRDLEPIQIKPYFKDEFEVLRQQIYLSNDIEGSLELQDLWVLAGQDLHHSISFTGLHPNKTSVLGIPTITGDIGSNAYLGAICGNLPVMLMHKLAHIQSISLRHHSRLRNELPLLCKLLTTHNLSIMDDKQQRLCQVLKYFMLEVLSAHQHLINSHELEAWSAYLKCPQTSSQVAHRELVLQLSEAPNTKSNSQWQKLSTVFRHILDLLDTSFRSTESQNGVRAALGKAWVEFALICLESYLPDHPFDPALGPKIIHQTWAKRRNELRTEIFALEEYERVMTGQPTEFRRNLLTEKLQRLGPEPETLSIVRPQKSKIVEIHMDLMNIQRTVLDPFKSAEHHVLLNDEGRVSEVRRYVAANIERLNTSPREYDDITQPAIGFLRALDVGLALNIIPQSSPVITSPDSKSNFSVNGLFGMNVQRVLEMIPHQSLALGSNGLDHRHLQLQSLGLSQHIQGTAVKDSLLLVADCFRHFHREWKTRLSEEQSAEAARSSLYHFKGDQETTSPEAFELNTLFPTFDMDEEISTSSTNSISPSLLAQMLADIHADLFSSPGMDSSKVLKFLSSLSKRVVAVTVASRKDSYPLDAADMLASLIPSLYQEQRNHLEQPDDVKTVDFYNQPNLYETSRLTTLARRLRTRFKEIREVWPEHATLGHVLQTVEDILDSKYTDPLAKLINIVEKLHSFVYEWQTVASREFSAAPLYEELTQLLVDWRRSELSTWSHLLDREERNYAQEAKSWWFVAYEAILHPFSASNVSVEEAQMFAVQLSSELQTFMKTASLGQFMTRMEILTAFQRQSAATAKIIPAMLPVAEVLAHTIEYFKRWQSKIVGDMTQRRSLLDAKMKDIILLASWKDTNIEALNASARRSHNSLFKVIKKYRDILSTPIEALLAESPKPRNQADRKRQSIEASKLHVEISVALATISSDKAISTSLPHRLLNSVNTASLMSRVGRLPEREFDPIVYLESVNDSLKTSIKSLQQETPSTLTKETKTLVKHLKTRKRNLLSETLKELKIMGIRSNLNIETLETQNTTPKILATLAKEERLSVSTEDLYIFLDNISEIRGHARRHSNDLSPGDVSRCIGFLEGLLSHICNQHRSLCSTLEELDACDTLLELLHKLWRPSEYQVSIARSSQDSLQDLKARLRWASAIISTARRLVVMTTSMSQLDYTKVSDQLSSCEAKISSLASNSKTSLDLSCLNLRTSLQADYTITVEETLQSISLEITGLIENYPNLRFILDHVLPWLNSEYSLDVLIKSIGIGQQKPLNGLSTSRSELLGPSGLDDTIRQMLVGLQYFKSGLEGLPHTRDDSAWFVNHTEVLKRAARSLQMNTIVANLESSLLIGIASDERSLQSKCATIALVMPLLEQYRNGFVELINHSIAAQTSICQFASTLSSSFKQIVIQGFCTPTKESKEEKDNGKTEGVGLGEGEGAEDISKDIQNDEDLSELAKGSKKVEDKDSDTDELEKEDNAVDLGHDELDGDFDSEGQERESENGDGNNSDEEQDAMSEEVGSVNDLDPSALDEKLWNEEADNDRREKEGNAAGEQKRDEKAAQDEVGEEIDAASNDEDAEGDLDEHRLDTKEMDQLNPHVDEGENLDLPEDMQMDGQKVEESDEDIGDGFSESSDDQINKPDTQDDMDEDGGSEVEDADEHDQIMEGSQTDLDEPLESEVEAHHDVAEEEIRDSVSKPDTTSTTADHNVMNDRGGSGADAVMEENEELKVQGENRNVGANPTDSRAEDSNTTKSSAQTGEAAPAELDKAASDSQDKETEHQQPEATPQAFRKLGEALERWRRTQSIYNRSKDQITQPQEQSEDVQHLDDDDDMPDAQVLGPAAEDEAHALNKDELNMEMDKKETDTTQILDAVALDDEDVEMETLDAEEHAYDRQTADTFIGSRTADIEDHKRNDADDGDYRRYRSEEIVNELDNELSEVKISSNTIPSTSFEQARTLWQICESSTRDLALSLTEQLRLILAPSLATKMRGDFRTGKRLNIKRIIPYIASGYKRDKIWMRRSVPSKRSYQVMLAVDDSKSMTESGSSKLAFETLALLSRSLSLLEVGQICVASFGEDFQIAHGFDQQFSTEGAIKMFQHFTFDQTKTNVQNLMAKSLNVFREARAKQSTSNTDLWQLQLIISDGVCEDHDSIRRLVRQAHEERIMVVFAVINSAGNHSILNMTQASFEPDENGETKLKIKKYLQGFPFSYYLIVGDIKNLPGVLSAALRQWFAEVADSR